MDVIYLDNNATTRPLPEVAAAVDEANRTLWANPSSVHRFGQTVRQRLELARAATAQLIGVRPNMLTFTSGGTEANNLAIWGTLPTPTDAANRSDGRAGPGDSGGDATLITMATEHAAVRELAEAYEKRGGRVVWLPALAGGVVELDALKAALAQAAGLVLVSVMWANNETGVIQPMDGIGITIREAREAAAQDSRDLKIIWHVDATQAVGKLPVDAMAMGVDLLTLAAHKFHGPKGVGALYLRRGVRVRPVQFGGPQERERRGGTENVSGIVGMGVAAQHAAGFLEKPSRRDAIEALRDRLEERVRSDWPELVVNSGGVDRLWNTANLGFTGLEAEAILLGLSERGVCASAGAACSSGSLEPSPVLRAMGVPEATAHGSIRLSLSRFTTADEVDRAASVLIEVVSRLAKVMPMGR